MKDDKRGLYGKYLIDRLDDTGKHARCKYFVLDMTHDEFAPTAMRAYVGRGRGASWRTERPAGKFSVSRIGDETGKHDDCEFVVLDLTAEHGRFPHDERARRAIEAYATACAKKYPALSLDLRAVAHGDRSPLRKVRPQAER